MGTCEPKRNCGKSRNKRTIADDNNVTEPGGPAIPSPTDRINSPIGS